MTRRPALPAPARRPALSALLLAALACGTALPATAAATTAVGVVSFAPGAAATVPDGLAAHVTVRYPHVGAAAVRGTPAALAALARRPGVRAVVPDDVLEPNDSGDRGSGDSVFAWEGLGRPAGRPGTGAGVDIALIDTGVSDSVVLDRASGRLVDAVDTSGEGRFTDGYGHGTFMAGVLAGGPGPNTGKRTLGVAPGARVHNVKVADATGRTSLTKVLGGLDWVAARAGTVEVAAFAFSKRRPGRGYGPDPLTDAVERVRTAGVTVVLSAGNKAGEVGDPGFDPWALTVGAADLRGDRPVVAPWSGGAVVAGVHKPDLVGSGVGVLSVLPPRSTIARRHPDARQGELWRGSGTSQATAQTAGVAAIFLARFPGATPAQVKASLRAAADPVRGRWSGAGLTQLADRLVDGSGRPRCGRDRDDGTDWSGEGGFDANSWSANSWSANSWSANSWSANSWSANSWSANSWSRGGDR